MILMLKNLKDMSILGKYLLKLRNIKKENTKTKTIITKTATTTIITKITTETMITKKNDFNN